MEKNYQTLPVTIEAIQWTGKNNNDVYTFSNGAFFSQTLPIPNYIDPKNIWQYQKGYIHTDRGDIETYINDYIIKDVSGEFYPCLKDTFMLKYQEVQE